MRRGSCPGCCCSLGRRKKPRPCDGRWRPAAAVWKVPMGRVRLVQHGKIRTAARNGTGSEHAAAPRPVGAPLIAMDSLSQVTMTLRMAMAVLLAMALLEGALGRPHSPLERSERNELPPVNVRHHKQHHRHGHHHLALQERRQLCGSNLSDALRLLCAGRGYYSPDSNSGSSRHGGDTGVATECCREGCSQQDLEQYCQPRKNTAPPPLALSDSSPETTEEAGSVSLDSAHQANHIRQSMEASNNVDPANKPTVVGGKTSFDMAAMHYNMSEMIKVGTIPQHHYIPVRIPLRHKPTSPK